MMTKIQQRTGEKCHIGYMEIINNLYKEPRKQIRRFVPGFLCELLIIQLIKSIIGQIEIAV